MFIRFLEEVEIKNVFPPKYPLRKYEGNLDELMVSINEKGLLQPILVRPVNGGYEVVAGYRRLMACKKLGWTKVSCYVVELEDKQAYEVSLTENIQRKSMNPIEEAEAFRAYIEKMGYGGVTQLAKAIGKSQEYVSKRLRLLDLPEEVKLEVMRGRIAPSVAEELLSFDEDYVKVLKESVLQGQITRQELRMIKRAAQHYQNQSVQSITYNILDFEKRPPKIERAINQSVAALKVCLMRIDDILDYMDDEWVVRESLFELRTSIHNCINNLLTLRKKFLSRLPPI